jgi:membrane-bound lytic murein transglycosylase D
VFALKDVFNDTSAHVPGVVNMCSMGVLAMAIAVPVAFSNVEEAPASEVELAPLPVVLPETSAYPDLPLELNERVEYWIRRFTSDQRPTFELFLTQEGAFGDLIREKLRARGMPDNLLYLAMIESGLRPGATSRVEAAGVWQFMGPTAEAYGLRVDPWVDERRDPLKATDAALDYLAWLHDYYQSWYMAAAAYNAGPTRVNQVLQDAGMMEVRGDSVYWQVRHLLPFETREYVPRLLAAAFLASALHENGFHQVRRESPYEFDQVWVPGGTSLSRVAGRIGMDRDMLWVLNPHLVQGRTPPGEAYPLRVPVGAAFQVVASLGDQPWSARLADD